MDRLAGPRPAARQRVSVPDRDVALLGVGLTEPGEDANTGHDDGMNWQFDQPDESRLSRESRETEPRRERSMRSRVPIVLSSVAMALLATATARAANYFFEEMNVNLDFRNVTPGANVLLWTSSPDIPYLDTGTPTPYSTTAGGFNQYFGDTTYYTYNGARTPAQVAAYMGSHQGTIGSTAERLLFNEDLAPTYSTTPANNVPTTMFCLDLIDGAADSVFTLRAVGQAPRPIGNRESTLPNGPSGTNGYPMGDIRADWLGVLANNYWTDTYLDSVSIVTDDLGGTVFGGAQTNSNYRYAALQVAIWEIVFEGLTSGALPTDWNVNGGPNSGSTAGGNPAAGDFSMVSDTTIRPHGIIQREADRILDSIQTLVGNAPSLGTGSVTQMYLGALTSDTRQDMLARAVSEVPEPSGLVLAGLGLVGLLSRRKQRV